MWTSRSGGARARMSGRRPQPRGPMLATRAPAATLLRHQDEVLRERGLAARRVELRDEDAVAPRADAHVQVRRPAGVATREGRLVAIAALGVRPLGRAVRGAVVAGGVGRPPLERRARERRAARGRAPDG